MQRTLSDDQEQYVRSLVRMHIRRQRRKIAGFAPQPGQPEAEAAGMLAIFTARLEFATDTYRALGGDPDQIAPRGGQQS